MEKTLNKTAVRDALATKGLSQKTLASMVGVSSQAVTNWLSGKDFPRPAPLLKLAIALGLDFARLVQTSDEGQPIIAFRKKGSAKTTLEHVNRAREVGLLLKPLVPYLPEIKALRRLITSPSTQYQKLQIIAAQTRDHLGIGEQAVLEYGHLIREFKDCGAILVPVLWGQKGSHENAMHVRLPKEDITFIFLNLDTRMEDFKFWMTHELAHVYTPDLAGTDEGEDFADAFAGALLFPKACAEAVYSEAVKQSNSADILRVLATHANHHMISIYSVFEEIKRFANAAGLPPLSLAENLIHAHRNSNGGPLVSEAIFDPLPPPPGTYIAAFEHQFESDFFKAVRRLILENDTGPSYLQQILRASPQDALALHKELRVDTCAT